ncbi:TauD/TfdA family dioxygenase [Gammaproteobacteria bacterium]|jgi:taurine dioxygenase|nr:TauD/TfdA family dioxygenase [Gammaproteobacteria bacterium]
MKDKFHPDEFESRTLPFEVNRLSPTIGGELLGVDLREDLTSEIKELIYEALLVYKVIFFRDQDLTTDQHIHFSKNFGDLEVHPFAPFKEGYPEVLKITHNEKSPGRENLWHSDVTWRKEPSLGSVLRMLEKPENGGDTLFSDMYAAYDDLSDEVKQRLEGAVAVHDFVGFRKRLIKEGKSPKEIEAFNKKFPMPEHPVFRTHPDTGKKVIYVNRAFTQYIKGWEENESKDMLDFLYSRASTPEYQCRFAWENNSIAFWDNRACQHYANSDYWPQIRRVERVTIVGDRPV